MATLWTHRFTSPSPTLCWKHWNLLQTSTPHPPVTTELPNHFTKKSPKQQHQQSNQTHLVHRAGEDLQAAASCDSLTLSLLSLAAAIMTNQVTEITSSEMTRLYAAAGAFGSSGHSDIIIGGVTAFCARDEDNWLTSRQMALLHTTLRFATWFPLCSACRR